MKTGPQQSLWSFDFMLSCLLILTVTFFLLTIYSILQANMALLPEEFRPFLSFKILDTLSAASLFVTLVGAMLVRHQFSLGLLPRINYRSYTTTITDPNNSIGAFEVWRVEVRNSGLGAAIITNTHYLLELPHERSNHRTYPHSEIVERLASIKLILNHDYWLANNSTGFALSPKDDCIMFEIRIEHLTKLKRLNMMLYFRSQLGGRYYREIFLIPGSGITPKKQVL